MGNVCVETQIMVDFLLYLGSGKLLLYLSRKFPPIRRLMTSRELLRQLYSCDLCYGFWVYLALTPFFDVDAKQIKNKILRWILTSCFATFLAHLVSIGWEQKFGIVVIEDANG